MGNGKCETFAEAMENSETTAAKVNRCVLPRRGAVLVAHGKYRVCPFSALPKTGNGTNNVVYGCITETLAPLGQKNQHTEIECRIERVGRRKVSGRQTRILYLMNIF
jgi:hypothetical protein